MRTIMQSIMSTMHTLDSLLARLQELKAAGTPGDIPVAIPARDNNGRGQFAQRITCVSQAALSSPEFKKGWELCKLVTNRGALVLLLG